MPKEVSVELTEHPGKTIAQDFPNVTVLFTDIVGFTKISGYMTADEVVNMLNKMGPDAKELKNQNDWGCIHGSRWTYKRL